MNVNSTTSSSTANTYSSAVDKVLGKDDFLKLLMTQLANQDPLSPMQDKDFIAQMAQFSSLEQMQNLGKSMETLTETQTRGALVSQATALIGRDVKIQVQTGQDQDGNPTYTSISGKVDKVKLAGGVPTLVIGDKEYQLADVLEVA